MVISFKREQSDAISRLTRFAKREMRSWSDDVLPLPAKDYQRRMARLAADFERYSLRPRIPRCGADPLTIRN